MTGQEIKTAEEILAKLDFLKGQIELLYDDRDHWFAENERTKIKLHLAQKEAEAWKEKHDILESQTIEDRNKYEE